MHRQIHVDFSPQASARRRRDPLQSAPIRVSPLVIPLPLSVSPAPRSGYFEDKEEHS
jgi:hypothetical protein